MINNQSVLNFDGQDDYVEVASIKEVNSQEFTISLWAKISENKGKNIRIIGFRIDKTTYQIVVPANNKWGYYLGDNGDLKDVVFNQWTHIVITLKNSYSQFYINGELINEININQLSKKTQFSTSDYSLFTGQLTRVCIWNYAQTPAEIRRDMNHILTGKESGLVNYWPINEGSGNTIYDQTSNANHGKIYGATWTKLETPVIDVQPIENSNNNQPSQPVIDVQPIENPINNQPPQPVVDVQPIENPINNQPPQPVVDVQLIENSNNNQSPQPVVDVQPIENPINNQPPQTVVDVQPIENPINNQPVLKFDGQDDYIEVPYSPSINPNQFTLFSWAKVEGGAGSFRSVITSRDAYPSKGYIIYAADNNRWQFWIGSNLLTQWKPVGGSPIILNTWTSLAATSDGKTIKFYVNGELVGDIAANYVANISRSLRIGTGGTEGNPRYFFNGKISEVRIWNRVLTQDEIKQSMNHRLQGNEPGLVGYWPLNEGNGNTVSDKTANNNIGTIYGANWQQDNLEFLV